MYSFSRAIKRYNQIPHVCLAYGYNITLINLLGSKTGRKNRNFETTRKEKDKINKGISLVTLEKPSKHSLVFFSLQIKKLKNGSHTKQGNKGEGFVDLQCQGIRPLSV